MQPYEEHYIDKMAYPAMRQMPVFSHVGGHFRGFIPVFSTLGRGPRSTISWNDLTEAEKQDIVDRVAEKIQESQVQ